MNVANWGAVATLVTAAGALIGVPLATTFAWLTNRSVQKADVAGKQAAYTGVLLGQMAVLAAAADNERKDADRARKEAGKLRNELSNARNEIAVLSDTIVVSRDALTNHLDNTTGLPPDRHVLEKIRDRLTTARK
jgi:hypothetical protein